MTAGIGGLSSRLVTNGYINSLPALLRQQQQPTFVTINERDFWRKVAIDRHFCVICFAVPDSRAWAIPELHG